MKAGSRCRHDLSMFFLRHRKVPTKPKEIVGNGWKFVIHLKLRNRLHLKLPLITSF